MSRSLARLGDLPKVRAVLQRLKAVTPAAPEDLHAVIREWATDRRPLVARARERRLQGLS